MSDFTEKSQMTFDFDGFSDAEPVSPGKDAGKVRADETPGFFDPAVSEEEEMEDLLRKVRSSESSGAENALPPDPEPELDFESDPEPESGSEPETEVEPPQPAPESEAPAAAEPETEPEPEAETGKFENKRALTRKQLQRAALAFLASRQPSGLAADVTACGSRCKAGAAAFWMESGKVVRTAVAEIRTAFDVLQTAGHAEQFQQLKLARMERDVLEQEIRRTEPELCDRSMLFSDFEQWDYEATENPSYRECLRRIRQLEHSLFRGSRLERFRTAGAASELYLIVPEHAVSAETLADGWGLVYIRPDLSFELVRPAEVLEKVPEKNLVRLALNIASANAPDVLFANGIRPAADDGAFRCGLLPRRRHRKS